MSISEVTDSDGETDDEQRLKLDGSVMGEFLKYRLKNNRDAKIIITSRSSSTGLGKSTLAILIAEWIHRTQGIERWNAEKFGFINVNDYISTYLDSEPGTALLLDEIEAGADNRRAMSSENVNLSKAWATLRFKNVVTISTLPTTSMLDGRLLELADIWINVMSRGIAIPYFIWINDFTNELRRVAAKHPETGAKEIIHWDSIDSDENFQYMSELKDTDVFSDNDKTFDYSEVQSKKKQARRDERNEIIKTLYENTNLSQSQIGQLVDLQQQAVSQIINQK
jgi:predicted XRE-type DNA-binding protein